MKHLSLQKLKTFAFEYAGFLQIKLIGSILSVAVSQKQAVSISRHHTMVHHNME